MTRLALIELLSLPVPPQYTQQCTVDTLVLLNEGFAQLQKNIEADGSGDEKDVLGVSLSKKGVELRSQILNLVESSS